ncbi:MAG: Fic family protein [Azospirillum sp.]|nr:Fic family protein [Azospirillum sp.]
MGPYIWQRADWPQFRWDRAEVARASLAAVRQQGVLTGMMRDIGFDSQRAVELDAAVEDVIKTSRIEGEILDATSVRSSIARRLGIDFGGLPVPGNDRRAEGIIDVVLDAVKNAESKLDPDRLFGWHGAMFPTGRSGFFEIDVACWRTDKNGPMQVVSGTEGRAKKVHFEAPPASAVEKEMTVFFSWLNAASPADGLQNAALAHLWFATIHPFDDGNGRIARAIADYAIARMEGPGPRFYSISGQIERDKKRYYQLLEESQKGDMDVTKWMLWFIETYRVAVENTEAVANQVVAKAMFWRKHAGVPVNDRQRKVINRLIDGFDGKMTTTRWASIAQTSQDTSYRDILDLIAKGLIVREDGAARKTSYRLILPDKRIQKTAVESPPDEPDAPRNTMRP